MTNGNSIKGLAALLIGLYGCNDNIKFKTPDIESEFYHKFNIESKEDLKIGYLEKPIYVNGDSYVKDILENKRIQSYLKSLNKTNDKVEIGYLDRDQFLLLCEGCEVNFDDNSSLEERAKKLTDKAFYYSLAILNASIALNCANRNEVLSEDIDLIVPLIDKHKKEVYAAFININDE